MKVFRSADYRWRLEQGERLRLFQVGPSGGLLLRADVASVAELAAWLAEHGDPVDEWVED